MVISPAVLAELVDDDGQVVAVGAEVAQQLVQPLALGHEHRRAQQRAQVQLGRALQLQQVLGHQDADDVVAPAVVHRKARVRGLDHHAQQLVVAARRCPAGPCAAPATITSPAVMSAMRSTPSSICRDSGSISSRCSASASVAISSARESGPGEMNSTSRSNRERLSSAGRRCRAGWGSDNLGAAKWRCAKNTAVAGGPARRTQPLPAALNLDTMAASHFVTLMHRPPQQGTLMSTRPDSRHHPHRLSRLGQDHACSSACSARRTARRSPSSRTSSARRTSTTTSWCTTAGEQIIQLNNGCVCCTIREDLRTTLSDLAEKKRKGELDFDRVVIETTGLADPGPVAQTFFMDDEIAESYLLDSILTLVDAKHADSQLDTRQEARRQVGFADQIFISKTDLVDDGRGRRADAPPQAHEPARAAARRCTSARCRSPRCSTCAAST